MNLSETYNTAFHQRYYVTSEAYSEGFVYSELYACLLEFLQELCKNHSPNREGNQKTSKNNNVLKVVLYYFELYLIPNQFSHERNKLAVKNLPNQNEKDACEKSL